MNGVFLIFIIQADFLFDFLKVNGKGKPRTDQFALIVFA
jgi:hypothetical protein